MPASRPYTISASPERLTLNKKTRIGEVSFTVTNDTERPIRTEVRVRVLDSADAAWFSLASGETVREIASGKSSQCTVEVRVPATAELGDYRFRLDANSVNHPEEIFTEGPVVQVEVPPVVVETNGGFKFKWWMAAAPAAVLVLLLTWLFWPKGDDGPQPAAEIEVPNVVGFNIDQAEQRLVEMGFGVEKKGPVPKLEAKVDEVISQDPSAPAKAKRDSVVTVTYVGDTVKVPDVRGQSVVAGLDLLTASGLKYGGTFGDKNRANEPLVGSSPAAGTPVLRGSDVNLQLPGGRVLIPSQQLNFEAMRRKAISMPRQPLVEPDRR